MRKVLSALFMCIILIPFLFAAEKEGGIVGTGVVGQVTNVDKFEVSGMLFEINQNMTIEGIESLEDIEMGMTLAVRTTREGDDWFATEIRRVPLLVGPVTGRSEVMGISVIGELPPAERVSVDGFWSEAGIVVTYVEAVSGGEDRIIGPVNKIQNVGELIPSDNVSLPLQEKGIFAATGVYRDGAFYVSGFEKGLFTGEQPNLLMAEGFFSRPDQNGETSLIVIDARQSVIGDNQTDLQKKSTVCAFNGRLDFDLEDVAEDERETVTALCSNLPR